MWYISTVNAYESCRSIGQCNPSKPLWGGGYVNRLSETIYFCKLHYVFHWMDIYLNYLDSWYSAKLKRFFYNTMITKLLILFKELQAYVYCYVFYFQHLKYTYLLNKKICNLHRKPMCHIKKNLLLVLPKYICL